MVMFSLGDVSATIETENLTDSNLTQEISENANNTTNANNSTNLTDMTYTPNGTDAAGDNDSTKNINNSSYIDIRGIWLPDTYTNTVDMSALIGGGITDIFIKVNQTNYQIVLNNILNKTIGTGIQVHAGINCFQDASGNWIDPQGKYSYQVAVPYTVKVQTPYQQWYKGWYTKAYKVKVKKWYKSYYKYRGKVKYKWKYQWTYKTKYKRVYGWTYKTAYKTSDVTKYNYETKYGYNTTYNDNLISFISNVANYSANGTHVNGIYLDYVKYPGNAYNYTNGTQTITSFVAQVYNKVKSINSSVAVSASVMPEKSMNDYYYGQNYAQLANYLDFMVPMVYKGNYGYNSSNGTDWIGSTVQYIVNQTNGTPVVAGLQTYNLSTTELDGDIRAALDNGASGYILNLVIAQYRPVYITSDNINSTTIDTNRINTIVNALRESGLTAVNWGLGPNTHYSVLQNVTVPANALIIDIYGGACAGTIYEMGLSYYKKLVGSRKVFCVWMPNATDITGLDWLPRAHDDNFSPASFTGIANPDKYLFNNGYDYIYSGDLNAIIAAIFKEATE